MNKEEKFVKMINDLKKEKIIFNRYRKKYKLFDIFLKSFSMLLGVKILLQLFGTDLNSFFNNWYNIFLGLSMSALFYYWIEYKRTYINIEKNKEKVLKILEKVEGVIEKVYSTKRHHSIKWDYYLESFDHLEYLIGITYKFSWFETSYVESLMWIQIQDHYTYFKRKKHKILEKEQVGEKLFKKEGSNFDKKLSQAIKFEEVKEDVRNNEELKRRLCISDEMERKKEEVTGKKLGIGGAWNFYYEYCEEEVLIIKCLLVITDDIRKIVSKLKV